MFPEPGELRSRDRHVYIKPSAGEPEGADVRRYAVEDHFAGALHFLVLRAAMA